MVRSFTGFSSFGMLKRRSRHVISALCSLIMCYPSGAAGQNEVRIFIPESFRQKKTDKDEGLRTVTVFYRGGIETGAGFEKAKVDVRYKLLNCNGEIHIAYSLAPDTVSVEGRYITPKGSVSPDFEPPNPSTIEFKGIIRDGYATLGRFDDKMAGKALGFGCFNGQTQKVAMLSDYLSAKATPDEIKTFLGKWHIEAWNMEISLTSAEGTSAVAAQASREADQVKAEEARKATEANERAAALVRAQTEKMLADRARSAAEMERYQADKAKYEADKKKYDADLAQNRIDVAAAAKALADYQQELKNYKAAIKK